MVEIKTIKLSEIKIKESFKNHQPNLEKIENKKVYIMENGKPKKYIVLDKEGFLIDGYADFIALSQLGFTYVDVKKIIEKNEHRSTIYVIGYHVEDENKRLYMWRVKYKDTNLFLKTKLPGDTILANTKYGHRPIVIVRIEHHDTQPEGMKYIKTVIC